MKFWTSSSGLAIVFFTSMWSTDTTSGPYERCIYPGDHSPGMCTFPEVNTSQSSNIICSSEYMDGPVYTPPDLSHCDLYGRVECQAKMSAFSQGLMVDSRCKNEVDITRTATVNCTLMKDGNSSLICWQLYIYFVVGCERTNGSVIPLVGSWTRDFNREHFCLYIAPPKIAEKTSPTATRVDPTATSYTSQVQNTGIHQTSANTVYSSNVLPTSPTHSTLRLSTSLEESPTFIMERSSSTETPQTSTSTSARTVVAITSTAKGISSATFAASVSVLAVVLVIVIAALSAILLYCHIRQACIRKQQIPEHVDSAEVKGNPSNVHIASSV